MTTTLATTRSRTAQRPARRPGTAQPPRTGSDRRPRAARPAQPVARAPRIPFVFLIVGLLGGALVSLLLLNTMLAEDAFRLNDLQQQTARLSEQEQALKQDVARAEAPGEIARRARALGMRPSDQPAFVSAGQQKTIGGPSTGGGR